MEGQFTLPRGLVPPQELGVGAEVSNHRCRVVLRRDVVKDNSGSSAVCTEQGSSASHMDERKSSGRLCQASWMRQRRSISLHPSQNTSQVRMSRYVDSLTTTHVAKNVTRHSRTGGSS